MEKWISNQLTDDNKQIHFIQIYLQQIHLNTLEKTLTNCLSLL